MPVQTAAKDLWQTGLIDDVIIGNAFASDAELKALGELSRDLIELEIEILPGIDEIERKILLEEPHFNRGDVSDYMIRSTQSRVKYKGHSFSPKHTNAIESGDVLIESSLYARYAGELQIAKLPMPNSGKTSIVAKISQHERFLIEHIKPWQRFKFVEKK